MEHPIEVGELLHAQGCPEHVVVAGLLHDVLERSAVEVGEIRRRFGLRVAGLVEAMTEDPGIASYEERKAAHRRQVAAAGREAAMIFVADKLAKARELRRARDEEGEMPSMSTPVEAKLDHYRRTLEMFERVAPELPLLQPLRAELEALSPPPTRRARPALAARGRSEPT